jgi:inhibitor of the pro-sigma K processing machinery
MKIVLIFIACIAILVVFGKSFAWPIKLITKLIINSALGALLIFIINLVGTSFNFHIGLNVINSVIVGILGIPGAVLLILIKIFV